MSENSRLVWPGLDSCKNTTNDQSKFSHKPTED